MTLSGTAIGSGKYEYGVDIEDNTTISVGSGGTLKITGNASPIGDAYAAGVYIDVVSANFEAAQISPAGPLLKSSAAPSTSRATAAAPASTSMASPSGMPTSNPPWVPSRSPELPATAASSATSVSLSPDPRSSARPWSPGGQVSAGAGGLTIGGTGNGTGNYERGHFESGAQILDTQNGYIKITGNGSALGTDDNTGVYVDGVNAPTGAPTKVETQNGSITIAGTGGGTTYQNYGIDVFGGALIDSKNGGNVGLTGTGGPAPTRMRASRSTAARPRSAPRATSASRAPAATDSPTTTAWTTTARPTSMPASSSTTAPW